MLLLQIDLSTIDLKSDDSDELLFHTSNVVNSSEIHVSLPDDVTTLPAAVVDRTRSPESHNCSYDDINTLSPLERDNISPVDIIALPKLTDSPEIHNRSPVDITASSPAAVVDLTRSSEIHDGSYDDINTPTPSADAELIRSPDVSNPDIDVNLQHCSYIFTD